MTASPIDLVLSRLDSFKLRETGRDRWRACCPAHGGKNPSALSIGVGDSAAVVLRCWQGCTVNQVADALGLDITDLFLPRPQEPGGGTSPMKRRRLLTATQALALLHAEALVLFVVGSDVRDGRPVSDADHDRLVDAVARVQAMAEEVYA